jgi:excisionase family DNA binding protein
VSPDHYTTGQAAKKTGISRQTLQAWIAAKKIQAPPIIANSVRIWTASDIDKLKEDKKRVHRDFRPRKAKPTKRKL